MENVFGSLVTYGEGWEVVNSRSFNQNEIDAVRSTAVVNSEYGKSVCFWMKAGGQKYIVLSRNSDLALGESIDMSEAKLLTLSRTGDRDIIRVEV